MTQSYHVTLVFVAAFSLLMFTRGGWAADHIAGEEFAVQNCGRCHAIAATGASPYANAPPFRVVARKYKLEYLQEALAEGIITGHNPMPEFILTPVQIDNLLAYFKTLK